MYKYYKYYKFYMRLCVSEEHIIKHPWKVKNILKAQAIDNAPLAKERCVFVSTKCEFNAKLWFTFSLTWTTYVFPSLTYVSNYLNLSLIFIRKYRKV